MFNSRSQFVWEKFDQIPDLTEWHVSDYKGVLHKVSQCIGDVNFAREMIL
jgi:hypothetical protein